MPRGRAMSCRNKLDHKLTCGDRTSDVPCGPTAADQLFILYWSFSFSAPRFEGPRMAAKKPVGIDQAVSAPRHLTLRCAGAMSGVRLCFESVLVRGHFSRDAGRSGKAKMHRSALLTYQSAGRL